MENKNWKNKNFFEALKNSLNGIKYTFISERNLKIQVVFAIVVIIVGFLLKISLDKWLILCLTIGIVFFAEAVNTAIEKVLDVYSEKYNENIKIAKDVASGAVLITAIMSVIIGCIIFIPEIINKIL